MPTSKPPYPAEFSQQIIELARAGRTPAQLSREFGPTAQSIANWTAQDGRARSMTMREIQGFLLEFYGKDVSPEFISSVTDAVMTEVTAWQARPLEPM